MNQKTTLFPFVMVPVALAATFLAGATSAQNGAMQNRFRTMHRPPIREISAERFIKSFEKRSGKSLTGAQKTQLKQAVEKRNTTVRQAEQNFDASVTRITGVSREQLRLRALARRQQRLEKRKEAKNEAAHAEKPKPAKP